MSETNAARKLVRMVPSESMEVRVLPEAVFKRLPV
jgi:hypothetical protein